ncbi:MAG TPA: cytochrome c oxidase assembly factor Coa1 family protein, partial [Candidatus Acidoferrales bacterium]|nr:cytochrome c oxidase assembly factor Coa1 family protein [Candidatus Acidoferrales bacterium]
MSFSLFHSSVREQPVDAQTGLAENRRLAAIAAGALMAGLFLFYLNDVRLRLNPAFAEAMNLLSHSTPAKAALGDPIKAEFGVLGISQNSASAGYAIFKAPVAGPARKGTIYVVANRAARGWTIEREVLEIGTLSEKIDLSPPPEKESFHYPATGHLYLL